MDIFRIEIDAVSSYNLFFTRSTSVNIIGDKFGSRKFFYSIVKEVFLCHTGSRALPEVVCQVVDLRMNFFQAQTLPFIILYTHIFLFYLISFVSFKSVSFHFVSTISYHKLFLFKL